MPDEKVAKKPLSPEAEQGAEFMRRNPDFTAAEFPEAIFRAELKKTGKPWNVENLQEVWDNLKVLRAMNDLASFTFLRKHPKFVINSRNAETLHRQMAKMGFNVQLAKDYTADNLAAAYKAVDPALWDTSEDKRPAAKVIPAPPPPAPEDHSQDFPWGAKLEGAEGRGRIKKMTGKEFVKYSADKMYGNEFDRQVADLQINFGRF